ncbi:MAG: acylneuraminate cytidylyltransferase family protein [Promethearchaeota archaeon]
MKILSTICARGGSKGVKNKNIRLLNGKPLIAYSIEALKSWNKTDKIICSTDSDDIRKIALKFGAETPFKRPSELATDTADKLDVLKHAVKFCEKKEKVTYDCIVDLDPTSPLRTVKDIDKAFNKFINSDADLLFSVYKSHKNPYFNMVELDENGYAKICKESTKYIKSRQQAPIVYSVNGSIYIYKRDFLIETSNILSGKVIIYEMTDLSIDIDREIDFDVIEYILKKRLFKFDY